MGNFYGNIVLRSSARDAIVAALRTRRKPAFVGPTRQGCTIVYDEACNQDPDELRGLAGALSREFDCAALGVMNHDDDIFWWTLHERGASLGDYDSRPGYFEDGGRGPEGGDAPALARAFGRPEAAAQVEQILRGVSDSAVEQHQALLRALGLELPGFALGYDYLGRGERDEGLTDADLTQVSP